MSKLIRKDTVGVAFHNWIVCDTCFSGHSLDFGRFCTFVKTFCKRQKTAKKWRNKSYFEKKCRSYNRLNIKAINEYYDMFLRFVDFNNLGVCIQPTEYLTDELINDVYFETIENNRLIRKKQK